MSILIFMGIYALGMSIFKVFFSPVTSWTTVATSALLAGALYVGAVGAIWAVCALCSEKAATVVMLVLVLITILIFCKRCK